MDGHGHLFPRPEGYRPQVSLAEIVSHSRVSLGRCTLVKTNLPIVTGTAIISIVTGNTIISVVADNASLATAMKLTLPILLALRQRGDGKYRLSF
jgi:hypothetical protein